MFPSTREEDSARLWIQILTLKLQHSFLTVFHETFGRPLWMAPFSSCSFTRSLDA